MRPILLNRKSVTWSAYLDMPIGFAPATSAQAASEVVFGEPGLCHVGPFQPGETQAWLVVLGVMNSGIMPIRDENFSVPLAFAFPGREVRIAQIRPAQSALPNATIPVPTAPADVGGSGRAGRGTRVRLHGVQLNRNDELTLTVILTGSPALDSPRIVQEGALTGGTIAAQPDAH
jgi:hypothetical protein